MRSLLSSVSGAIGLIVFIFGIMFSTAGLWELSVSYRLRSEGIKTQGVVIKRYNSSSTDHDVTMYVVSFSADKNYTVENHYGMLDDLYQVGDSVEVLYLSNAPEKARFNTYRELYLEFMEPLGLGLFLIILGSLAIFNRKKIDGVS